jgi:quercetin dioxygenase-like cupin family protein
MGAGGLTLLGRPLPPAFELRVVTLTPGDERPFDEAEWRDALVVVERGEIELEFLAGADWRCRRGDVLWLSGLPLRALHGRGREPAVLASVSRRSASPQ